MEITKKQLKTSIQLSKDDALKNSLDNIYNSIPGGTCDGCAKCCTESVQTFYVEFLEIYQYLKSTNQYDRLMEKIENHYFNELVMAQDCPFLNEEKQCLIYPVRPLVCRLFGHASEEEHEANYSNVNKSNQAADRFFVEEFGFGIGESVLNHKIEFCQSFIPGREISLDERNEMVDKMFMMDSKFLMADLIPEDAINMSLTNWFIYLKYSEELASDMRINKLLEHSKCKIKEKSL